MNQDKRQAGFSLMEVNMAVFVMAVGVLSMVVLFPLGLREGIQGKADLQQSMFADYVLNQIVAAASQTNLTWTQWEDLDGLEVKSGTSIGSTKLRIPGQWQVNKGGKKVAMQPEHFMINCEAIPRASYKLIGVTVRSTDEDYYDNKAITNNTAYYAEVMFQGIPNQ